MDRETIRTALAGILERSIGESVGAVEEATSLKTDLKLDSIDFVAMALEVQSEFEIELNQDEFPGVVLVKDLIDLIQRKQSAVQNRAA
jgi:acyl carrier protein